MKPIDYARRVVPINYLGAHVFVVSLANEQCSVPLTVTPSSQRADVLALIARTIIAGEIAAALRDEDCRIAAEIDQAYLANKIWCPAQASRMCRELAQTHTPELMPARSPSLAMLQRADTLCPFDTDPLHFLPNAPHTHQPEREAGGALRGLRARQ